MKYLGLPFIPKAQPGESPLSLLRRAALGNGYHSTLRFAFSLNSDPDHSASALGTLARNPSIYRKTCLEVGMSNVEIDRVIYGRIGPAREDSIVWNDLQVGVGDLQFPRNKLCMACYSEQGYSFSEWDHVAAVACPKHHILLDDACPICSKPWTYEQDPFDCGCAPEEVILKQEPCPTGSANLLNNIIGAADQQGLNLLAKVQSVVGWWKQLGVSLSRVSTAKAISDLFSGRWPLKSERKKGNVENRLHPRIALVPLLVDSQTIPIQHANQLLVTASPVIKTPDLSSITLPDSSIMGILGIGRVPFKKLVKDRHLTRDEDQNIHLTSVNALLLHATKYLATELAINPLGDLLSGLKRQSLSSLLTKSWCKHDPGDIKTPENCPRPVSSIHDDINPEDSIISISDACRKLHANSESVRYAIHVGLLEASRGSGSSRVKWCIKQDDLDSFDNKYVFGSALARQLGASRTTFSSRLISADIFPISGPGIDAGITYIFRRADLKGVDMDSILCGTYCSPAGRKRKVDQDTRPKLLSVTEVASVLKIPVRKVRIIVRQSWISPLDPLARSMKFSKETARLLEKHLKNDYQDIESAAKSTDQTVTEFRRAWIETEFISPRQFTDTTLVSNREIQKIGSLWKNTATASAIGKQLGRNRFLCQNLQKMGSIKPTRILGHGYKKVRLYSRNDPALEHFATGKPETR